MAEEKIVKVNEATNEVEVPVDLTTFEIDRLKEKFELFNNNVPEESKITFEEFISLVFKTSLLEEELTSKYNYLRLLEAEVKGLEKELKAKYSIGLTGSEEVYNEVIELRKKTLEDSSIYINNYKSAYIDLLVNYIDLIVYSMDYEDGVLTLKETFEEDIEKNPSEVYKAVNIVEDNIEESDSKDVVDLVDFLKNYVQDKL